MKSRDVQILVRVTDNERERIKERAEEKGMSVSEFVRNKALGNKIYYRKKDKVRIVQKEV